jgi:hypothetical protein
LAFVLTGPWQSQFGSWGHIFDEDDPAPWADRPKFQVLLDQIAQCTDTPLAVELLDFQVKCQPGGLHVTWTSALERDHDYFVLEKSDDGTDWSEIARKAAKGAGRYTLVLPMAYGSYYRLRSLDVAGKSQLSPIVQADCPTVGDVKIYPNPTASAFTVEIPAEWAAQDFTVRVSDALGRTKWAQPFASHAVTLGAHLPNGIYQIEIVDARGQRVASSRLCKMW